jgi:DNA polymerase III epsilon subunit-like protein
VTTRLVFIDTETTSLRPDRRVWEVGMVIRDPDRDDREFHWFIRAEDLDLGDADPFSLKVGGFYDRHPQMRGLAGRVPSESYVLDEVEKLTRGAHLVGAVPNFDADVLAARMRAHGILPAWHYHLIDVEGLAVGWLHGRRARQNEIVDGYPRENDGEEAPGLVRWNDPVFVAELPWKSDDLTAAVGAAPVSEEDRHTALGDARWAMAVYDAVTGGAG